MTTWNEQYQAGEGLRFWPCEDLLRYLGGRWPDKKAEGRVLDIGSGTGNNTWALTEWGFKAWMLEPSMIATGIAKSYLYERGFLSTTVANESILENTLIAGDFDGAIDMQTIQHFTQEEHLTAYREVRRLLKPGGWFFLYHLGNGTVNYEGIFPVAPPAYLIDSAAIFLMLKECGFEVQDMQSVTRTYNEGEAQYWCVVAEAV